MASSSGSADPPWATDGRARAAKMAKLPPNVEQIEAALDCAGLAEALRKSVPLFQEGWIFQEPLWGRRGGAPPYEAAPSDNPETEYLAVEVGNSWNDLALFSRRRPGQ